MIKNKINFICLLLIINSPTFSGEKQCSALTNEIQGIQKKQMKHKAFGTTVAKIEKSYDQNMAQLILLKGLKELKDDFWRAKGKMKISSVDKKKIKELEKKLEDGIKASGKLLAMNDLLKATKKNNNLLNSKNSNAFVKNLKRDCKKQKSELCNDLSSDNAHYASMVRGFSVTYQIAYNGEKRHLETLQEELKEDLPTIDKIKDELAIEKEIKRDIKRLNRCLEKSDDCGPELSLIKEKVQDVRQSLNQFEGLDTKQKKIALEDTYGDLETLVNSIKLQKEKNKGNLNKSQAQKLKKLNKRIKKNFEVANIRAKIRDEKYDPSEPPEVTDKTAKNIYKDLFKKLGCKKLDQCLEKLGPDKSILERKIAEVEDKIELAKTNLDKISTNAEYKNLEVMKALLVSMAQDECEKIKTEKGHPGFIACDLDMTKVSPHYKVNKFAFQIGRVMAEVDKDLFIDDSTPIKEKEKELKKVCKKDYEMHAKDKNNSSFCFSLYPDLKKEKLSKKISKNFNNLFLSDEEKVMKKCGPAKRCLDWIAFYQRYDVTRDDTGKGVAVQKIPSWGELIAPNLAKSVNTLLPVGLEMYTSDYYLKQMQDQAAYQMEVNVYREKYPTRTYYWDMGYRGFTDGYVGGPTPENPGVVGYGAIGNPYQGVGDWNPYGLSGVLPSQMGLYNYNPYYFGNFQQGNTFSYQQLTY
ncbi:MAG: hypothetical protein DRQ88_03705 [Epsilonproteobacteria bacterium]|nr:MAG: hypothetical protein DRQ89_03785 [Campylobacterota bacterium]RLA67280.1 MAG: hypothetical protein DRQ88_03705 [Campylobacterota bacterium]